MSLSIRISPKVSQYLDDLFQYLVRENKNIALKFFDSSREIIALLAQMPNLGKSCQFAHPKLKGLRQYRVKDFNKFFIFYFYTDNLLIIVRVIQGNRDIETILNR
ncbi:type II toxin-antitoxin system RelE/ParE family toxin [Geminocystis herdmanii]|uniref:type II toxin-antitoxin system RelE/ParE family toxin n=1 Tax=Geminocystis herdmanii TaxID=669359 RepID=UPI0003475ECC|nr:type II toxin-antitoxin system RelE/ParE family toxin [Geminocystis herdmanii]